MSTNAELYCALFTFFFGGIALKIAIFAYTTNKDINIIQVPLDDSFILFDMMFVYFGLGILLVFLFTRAALWMVYNCIDECCEMRRIKRRQRMFNDFKRDTFP